MPRAGLSHAAVVEAGAVLADEVGFDGLTMGLLAERLGVRTPSLYKHVGSLDAVRRGIAMRVARDLAEVASRSVVGKSGRDAVHAFADAYRRWVLDHPGRYAASVRAPDPGDEEHRRVGDESVRALLDVLAGLGLSETDAVDAARALRSAIHGFTSLENAGGFGLPRDVDRSYRFLVEVLIDGLRAVS
ncbi:transcriptional regulator, TetR family [Lentzea fradiae]|uniref:Transcriptional regulator, TetR family n=1 Tax=Lentzea fradiae TaxID=200378 RepID=A0A1G7PAV4_9PSEU|nr:TetR/AcrR family transcriptional regulator [Lentzea fradiae]SDF83247.1 transcriptional regulator, TetR family [Lentzea fradiae]